MGAAADVANERTRRPPSRGRATSRHGGGPASEGADADAAQAEAQLGLARARTLMWAAEQRTATPPRNAELPVH